MALQLSKIHEFKRPKDGGSPVLVRSNPAIRLSKRITEGDEFTQVNIFIQNGLFYTEDGKEVPPDQRPKWLPEALARLSPKAKEEAGLRISDPPKKQP